MFRKLAAVALTVLWVQVFVLDLPDNSATTPSYVRETPKPLFFHVTFASAEAERDPSTPTEAGPRLRVSNSDMEWGPFNRYQSDRDFIIAEKIPIYKLETSFLL